MRRLFAQDRVLRESPNYSLELSLLFTYNTRLKTSAYLLKWLPKLLYYSLCSPIFRVRQQFRQQKIKSSYELVELFLILLNGRRILRECILVGQVMVSGLTTYIWSVYELSDYELVPSPWIELKGFKTSRVVGANRQGLIEVLNTLKAFILLLSSTVYMSNVLPGGPRYALKSRARRLFPHQDQWVMWEKSPGPTHVA